MDLKTKCQSEIKIKINKITQGSNNSVITHVILSSMFRPVLVLFLWLG